MDLIKIDGKIVECDNKNWVMDKFEEPTEQEKADFKNRKKPVKKEEKEEIELSLYEDDEGFLYEQIRGFKFVSWQNGEFVVCDKIETPDTIIKPINSLEDIYGIVTLPIMPKEYGDVISLYNELKAYIHQWLDVDSDFENFAAWYILLTYLYDRFNTINYLSAIGDTGTGKSRFLNVIHNICYKSIKGSGGATMSAVKRLIMKWHGTLGIDEGDFKVSDETADLVKFLNLGFEKGQWVYNCDKNDFNKIEFFNPYCPKIITRRKNFTDQALEARCLTTTMKQTKRKDIHCILPSVFQEIQDDLRNKLLKFRFDYYNKINTDNVFRIDMGEVEPRLKQATSAFAVLFANMPEFLQLFLDFIREYQKKLIEQRAESFDGQIVNIIIDLILEEKMITPKEIAAVFEENKEKAEPRAIGKHLRVLGLNAVKKFIDGKSYKIIIITKEFVDLAKRFCNDNERIIQLQSKISESNAKKENQGTFEEIIEPQDIPSIPFIPCVTDTACHGMSLAPFVNQNSEKDKQMTDSMKSAVDNSHGIHGLHGMGLEAFGWDEKVIVYHLCAIEGCGEIKCNFDKYGVPYCKKHWNQAV